MAIVAEGRRGRLYLPPSEEHERIAGTVIPPHDLPDTDLPEEALGFRVQNYGMTKHRHLFTDRQLVALMTLCNLIREVHAKVFKDCRGDQGYADGATTYLALAVFLSLRKTRSWATCSRLLLREAKKYARRYGKLMSARKSFL